MAGASRAAGRRVRTGAANDARTVAGTATAAGRWLQPDPQPAAEDQTLVVRDPAFAADATTQVGPVSPTPTAMPGGAVTTAAVATVELPAVELHRGTNSESPGLAPDVTGASGGEWSSPVADVATAAPARPGDTRDGNGNRNGNGAPVVPYGRRPSMAAATVANGAHGNGHRALAADERRRPAAARAVTAPRPRDGVVVPLRVPWRTRLRATAGLFVLVVFLGTTAAVLVAAVAFAGAQALGNF